MRLFSKIFGKYRKGESSFIARTEKQNNFITNSPDLGLGKIELAISGKVRVDGILAIAAMEKIAKFRKKEFKFSVMHSTLLEEGSLTVPVACTIGESKYSIYFIYQEEDLLKYKDLLKHVSRTPYPNLIYFSSIPIYDGYQPTPIIEPFQLADLRVDNNAKIAGKFAMWWCTPGDPVFHKSKTFEHLSKLNEFMKGYETYMTGYVLRQTRIVPELELQRINLPQKNATYIIDGPEEKKIILDISQEKGIRFLFPIEKTSRDYRERFLRGAMVDFAANIISLRQHNLPVDDKTEPNSYEWFKFMSRVVKEKEESGELKDHQVGTVELNAEMN